MRPSSRGRGSAAPGRRSRECGFTLLELISVICLIALLATVGNSRLRYYQEFAEKALMEMTLSAMTAGLRYRMAQIMIRGPHTAYAELERTNPVGFLQEPPANYVGEFFAPEVSVPSGSWYYDSGRNEIVYVPALANHLLLEGSDSGPIRLRFGVKLLLDRPIDVKVSNDRPADVSKDKPAVVGIRLVPTVNYKWF